MAGGDNSEDVGGSIDDVDPKRRGRSLSVNLLVQVTCTVLCVGDKTKGSTARWVVFACQNSHTRDF